MHFKSLHFHFISFQQNVVYYHAVCSPVVNVSICKRTKLLWTCSCKSVDSSSYIWGEPCPLRRRRCNGGVVRLTYLVSFFRATCGHIVSELEVDL